MIVGCDVVDFELLTCVVIAVPKTSHVHVRFLPNKATSFLICYQKSMSEKAISS